MIDAIAVSCGCMAGLVAFISAVGALRAPTAADALHFVAPVSVIAAPLLGLSLSLRADGAAALAQIWIAIAAVVLPSAPTAHAFARMLAQRAARGDG